MSDKLISADRVLFFIKRDSGLLASCGEEQTVDDVIAIIKSAPAVDAVEVVRCKDCEFCYDSFSPWTKTSVQVCGYVGYNPVQSSQVSDNDFCSHGERRDDNSNG